MNDPKPPGAAMQMFGGIAPELAELSDDVLFGDVRERPELSKRDRSPIPRAALVAPGKTDPITAQFQKATHNGVEQEGPIERITHMAFHSGWPGAVTAVARGREIFAKLQGSAP